MTKTEQAIIDAAYEVEVDYGQVCKINPCPSCNLIRAVRADKKAKKKLSKETR